MRTEEWKLSDIKPYELNARHNDDAVPYVQKSIETYGYKVFIVIDVHGVIIAGHTRWKALRNINTATGQYDTVTVIVADDLTEDQVKEFRIVDNQVAALAEWDYQILKIELADLPNFHIEDFGEIKGFSELELSPEVLAEPEVKETKVQIKVGHETYDWDEAHYHNWAGYVVEQYAMSPMDFIIQRLMIHEGDRVYKDDNGFE